MRRLAWLALCWLAVGTGSALAAGRSVSYSTWIVSGNLVTVRLRLPVSEARRLVGVAVPVLTTERLKNYVLEHLSVSSAGGSCPAIDQGYDLGQVDPLAVGPDLYGFELLFRCSDPQQMVLRDTVLFANVPDHVNFALIRTHGQDVEQLFTAGRQQLALPQAGAPPAAGISAYLRIGLLHVLDSLDRWCVLLAALLLMRRWQEAGGIILALAGGYLLSLALSASGWVSPRGGAVEAFVGLLVALLGAVLALRDGQYRRVGILGWVGLLVLLAIAATFLHAPWTALPLLGGALVFAGVMQLVERASGWAWWLLIGLFALLDGVVMAAVLPPAQLPQRSLMQAMLGLDAGAWLIESLLLAVMATVLLLIRSQRMVAARAALDELAAAGLSGVGAFWLVSRLWV
jgi:uncharacterized membrane protein